MYPLVLYDLSDYANIIHPDVSIHMNVRMFIKIYIYRHSKLENSNLWTTIKFESTFATVRSSLKVLSSEIDPAEIRLIRQAFLKGIVAWVFLQNSPVPHRLRAL